MAELATPKLQEKKKIMTRYAQVIATENKIGTYFEILWYNEGKNDFDIGFGSYELDFVLEWLKEEFEFTEDKTIFPVVCAEWKDFRGKPQCSHCKKVFQEYYFSHKFCPECGAKMGM
ncbi:hypothetical protein [Intestinibacillus sp. Marseille-P6563]|uniref:hypothetical protein n=1 Tax=Intestinibacillus sp. Marseille-P6563 TaxID=2364792 RepID=UPI000F061932|nr:hypothetical protein [Intestinibacillus sp. Marseille-P6563]